MKLKTVYLLLCVMGAVLPYGELVPWVLRNGLKMQGFFQLLFANRVSAFFAMDVLVSSLVLWLFVRTEGKRLGVRRLWLPLLGLLTVGVSLGFPLFLYLREVALTQASPEHTSRAG
jgi:hypothetical protein